MPQQGRRDEWGVIAAIALIALGIYLLLGRIDLPVFTAVRRVFEFVGALAWPLLLIAAGVVVLVVSRRGPVTGGTRADGGRLYRSRSERMIGGVLGGLGAYLGVDPTWLRIGYVVIGLFSGFPALIVYILAMIVIPEEPPAGEQPPAAPPVPSAPPVPPAPSNDEAQGR